MLLQSIRDRATGWIAWVIVILISIPFALWGIQEYLSPASNVAVAIVNGNEVGINEFQRTYQRQRSQLQALLGQSFDINQIDEDRLREESLNQLINDEVVLQAAIAGGMRIGDQQLAHAIQSEEQFQSNGIFSEELYQGWLRQQGYSPGGFENDLKRSMLAEQLVAGLAASAIVSDREIENVVRVQGQKRLVDTLNVPLSRFADVTVDEAAISAHYEANQADFVSPEEVKLKYIEISRDAIAAGVDVDDEELRAVYDERKRDLQTPEQRSASHILLTIDDGADEDAVAEARARLEDLKKQIDGGASFVDLAREHSEDPGSAGQGGSLGTISRGFMDPAFEDAVFALALGEVSDPVRSAFGLHLIKVDSISESRLPSFDEVRDKLRAEYQDDKAERIFVDQVDTMATLAFENPESLDEVADALGLTPSVSDWVSPIPALNDGIGRNPAVTAAAFNPDVLTDGFNSEPIDLDASRVIVLRVAEHRPSRQRTLAEVHERIEKLLAAQEARRLAEDSGRMLLERLQDGEDAQNVATQSELVWSGDAELTRDARATDMSVVNTAFRLERPGAGQTVYGGTATDGGSFVIVALKSVTDGTLSGEDKALRDAARRNLEVDAGRAAYDGVVQYLRDQADVVIIRENM
jgi:peptidyl-prolyl cis-trans isomerase D